MKRTFRKWFLPLMIALIACLAGSFAACGKTSGKEPEGKSYTITFDVNGGASLSDKTWTEGTTLSLPTPSAGSSIDMYGYTFTGWFYDEDCTLAVDRTNFDVSYAAKGVITLYAGWTNLHSIYFDSKTSETIAPVQFAYGSVVSLSDLPVPSARTVGSTTCDFLYWIRTNTGNPVTEDFVMDAQDMYFHAVYDVGTNTRFELNNEGYYVPTSSESKTTHSRFRNYTLQDGQVYSVDMTLPENWTSYSDDCGPVFTGIHFDEAGTTFNNGHYIVMFISCQKNYNGAIEFWGTADVNGAPKD
ncbi:MAG: InlB B-repeat-containing protein, partial [Clostridia bacterium]|nr:InlB B-repeat-containing protein [Clostridia bacterium]